MTGNKIRKIFFSKNLLLTQENILDTLIVLISTIDASKKFEKVTSQNFFEKKKLFFPKNFHEISENHEK